MTITIPATPCHIPARPVSVDPKSLELLATARGVGVWLSEQDWRAMLKWTVDFNKAYDQAEGCSVP